MAVTVSIIVPCFNQAHFLAELIPSVSMACSYSHEIIIVDDGSTDLKTELYLRDLRSASKSQTISIIRKPNGGLASARNKGVRRACGEYIQFLDADDLLAPRKIDMQIAALEAGGRSSIHVCEYLLCDERRNQFWRPEPSTISDFSFERDSVLLNWERGFSIPIHCALFRARAIDGMLFNERFRAKEDWIFWIDVSSRPQRFIFNPFPGAIYRQHGDNMCQSIIDMAISWLMATEYILNHYSDLPDDFLGVSLAHYQNHYLKVLQAQLGSRFSYYYMNWTINSRPPHNPLAPSA